MTVCMLLCVYMRGMCGCGGCHTCMTKYMGECINA